MHADTCARRGQQLGDVAESADAADLKSAGDKHRTGSNPVIPTTSTQNKKGYIMSGAEFREILKQHNLTVNQLLDLRDEWNRLSAEEKYTLLKQEAQESNNNTQSA